VATIVAASREVDCSPECCKQPARGPIGLPTPAILSSFLTEIAVPTGCRPPPTFAGSFILSELRPSSECCSPGPAPPPALRLYSGAPSVGFLSLIAAPASSVLRRASQALRSPSAAFLTPSMVCSATGLVGLFHPTATSRVLPPGACSPHPAEPPRRWPVPSRRWRQNATDGCPPAPRPAAPPSGLCSGCGSVVRSTVVSRRPDPIPSWDFPPPGSPSRRRGGAFTSPPLRAFRKNATLRPFPSLTCSVSPTTSPACLSRGCRPARGS